MSAILRALVLVTDSDSDERERTFSMRSSVGLMVPSRLFTCIWRRVRKSTQWTRKRTAEGGPSAEASAAGLLVGSVGGSASAVASDGGEPANTGEPPAPEPSADDEQSADDDDDEAVTGILSASIVMLVLVMHSGAESADTLALTGSRPSLRCALRAHNGQDVADKH